MESSRDAIVSDERDLLILVDGRDETIGSLDKAACHDGEGVLHRAFSLFVFDTADRLLLQQRADGKRLWPGFWSNSCCSHPRLGERMTRAIHRRLTQELGLRCTLRELFKFEYHARYGEIGSEHEFCSVFAGRAVGDPAPNRTEVRDWRWIERDVLDAELERAPEHFTPWFHLAWARIRAEHLPALASL